MAIIKKTLLQKLYDLLPVIIVLFLTTIGFIIALIELTMADIGMNINY